MATVTRSLLLTIQLALVSQVVSSSREGTTSSSPRVTPPNSIGSKHQILDAGIQPLFESEQLAAGAEQRRKIEIKRKHLIVVTTETPPFMSWRPVRLVGDSNSDDADGLANKNNRSIKTVRERDQSNQTAKIEWYGYCVDFFEELIKHLPYEVTYELYRAPDGKFGSKSKRIILERDEKTGKVIGRREVEQWSGVVGELEQKRAHVALAPLAVMAERELVMDFTVPFYDLVGIQILLKKAEIPKDWFKFFTVLDNDVWLSIFIAYLVTSFVIYTFDRLSPYSSKNASKIRKIRQSRRRSSAKVHATIMKHNQASAQLNWSPLSIAHEPAQTPPTAAEALFASDTVKQIEPKSGAGSLATKWRRLSHDYAQSVGWRPARQHQQQHNGLATLNPFEADLSHANGATEDDGEEDDDLQRPTFNLRDSFWFCITSLTPQGGGEAPQNLSGRVVAGAWWLFCFIVIASYTANLAAFLTVSRLDIPIESLDDLAKQYRIKYAPIDGTAEQTYFERMAYIEEIFYNIWKEMSLNDSLSEEERSKFAVWDYPISDKYTKIWAQIQEVGMPYDSSEAMVRVKNSTLDDGFALLADANFVKFATMTDCSFKAVGDEFSRKPIALGVAKGNEQLRDDMSYAILKLINQRFMEVLREKWWTNNEARVSCAETTDESSEGMSIENIGSVFIIILAGVIFSFIVWAVERYVYKTKIQVSRNLIMSARGPPPPPSV